MEKRGGATATATFLLIGFLLLSHHSFAASRLQPTTTNKQEIKKGSSMLVTHEEEDVANLMGMDECGDGDEFACLKRRMVLEPHLDYIYTQHQHKPKASP